MGEASSLEIQERVAILVQRQSAAEPGTADVKSEGYVLAEFSLAGGWKPFVLFRPSSDWMRLPTL